MALSFNELSRLKQWLLTVLSADTVIVQGVGKHPAANVLQVYDKIAPELSVYPLIVFQFFPLADVVGGYGQRLFSRGALLVKTINQGTDESPLWPIADAVDADLQDNYAMSTPTGLIVQGCTRELLHNVSYVDDGIQYNELGGRYRLDFYMA